MRSKQANKLQAQLGLIPNAFFNQLMFVQIFKTIVKPKLNDKLTTTQADAKVIFCAFQFIQALL